MKRYAFWLVLLFLIVGGSYIVFREFYYYGTVEIYLSEEGATISRDGYGKVHCPAQFCALELTPQNHLFLIEKDGFISQTHFVDVKRLETQELIISLVRNSVMLEKDEGNSSFSGVEFPLDSSQIDVKVQNMEIENDVLLYENMELRRVESEIFVSSDEVGRNIWLVSDKEISGFSTDTKTLFPVLQTEISSFIPQKDGSFFWSDTSGSMFQYENGMQQNLPFIPYSLPLSCALPGGDFAFLERNTQTGEVQFSLFKNQMNAVEVQTIIENISPASLSYIECINDSQIRIVPLSSHSFLLSF